MLRWTLVDRISSLQFPTKRTINRFSFATKYASWHRQDAYPIWDQNVQKYFTSFRKLHRNQWDQFSDGFLLSGNWGYPEFYGLMVRFRSYFSLEEVGFKDLDKFLWIYGDQSTKEP
jgi:hypothetical protein